MVVIALINQSLALVMRRQGEGGGEEEEGSTYNEGDGEANGGDDDDLFIDGTERDEATCWGGG